jgi:hypothetical protein
MRMMGEVGVRRLVLVGVAQALCLAPLARQAAASCPPAEAPQALQPSGTITNPRPTFQWTGVAGAESYTLYVLRLSDDEVVVRQVTQTFAAWAGTVPGVVITDRYFAIQAVSASRRRGPSRQRRTRPTFCVITSPVSWRISTRFFIPVRVLSKLVAINHMVQ